MICSNFTTMLDKNWMFIKDTQNEKTVEFPVWSKRHPLHSFYPRWLPSWIFLVSSWGVCSNKYFGRSCPFNIRSNLRVAQNGRLVLEPVYIRSGTMMLTCGEILDFKLSESSKNELSRTFCSPKLSLESWI